MIFSIFQKEKCKEYLEKLPKISQKFNSIFTILYPKEFFQNLIQSIYNAKKRICLAFLYLEKDLTGSQVLSALYRAKRKNPSLNITILVDLHRAQRNRIEILKIEQHKRKNNITNADWYLKMAKKHYLIDVPIYGVPIHIREALGVLHLKGLIFDNKIIYTGASIKNDYLQRSKRYRLDRYKIIYNVHLSNVLCQYIYRNLICSPAVIQLNNTKEKKTKNIYNIRLLRSSLQRVNYNFPRKNTSSLKELYITPLVGMGTKNPLNQTLRCLLRTTQNKLTICTPYFNLPTPLSKDLIYLLQLGKKVEIIVGDKTSNDFYVCEDQPFQMVNIIPYLYEINLRAFLYKLQKYVDNQKLIVYLWKHRYNGFHAKGIWVDHEWQLLTGNNLNFRSWRFDLENALLIHDPKNLLSSQRESELQFIKTHTRKIKHFSDIPEISKYPRKIKKFIKRIRSIRIDRLIGRIM